MELILHASAIRIQFVKKSSFQFQSFKRVKLNRLLRRQAKRWQVKDMGEEAICPVCGEIVPAQVPADLQMHAEKCLRKVNKNYSLLTIQFICSTKL